MNPGNAAWDPSELVCVNQASYNGDLGGIRSVPNQSLIQPVLAPAANATVHKSGPWQQVSTWIDLRLHR